MGWIDVVTKPFGGEAVSAAVATARLILQYLVALEWRVVAVCFLPRDSSDKSCAASIVFDRCGARHNILSCCLLEPNCGFILQVCVSISAPRTDK